MSSFYNSENGTCIYLTRSIFGFGNRHFLPKKLNIVNLDRTKLDFDQSFGNSVCCSLDLLT